MVFLLIFLKMVRAIKKLPKIMKINEISVRFSAKPDIYISRGNLLICIIEKEGRNRVCHNT